MVKIGGPAEALDAVLTLDLGMTRRGVDALCARREASNGVAMMEVRRGYVARINGRSGYGSEGIMLAMGRKQTLCSERVASGP